MKFVVIGAALLAFAAVIGIAARLALPTTEPLPTRLGVEAPSLTSPDRAPNTGPIGPGDGFVADGDRVSPFDDDHPAIANLDPGLRTAVQEAMLDASRDGVEVWITAGWRSARYQQVLLDEATVTYGSEREARRWVSTPEGSTHVTGDAVDIGPTDATSWLSQHGSDYGLCQVYANEMWHFERLIEPGGVCPQQLRDAAASRTEVAAR